MAVTAAGGRTWHFRYYWSNKQKRMSLGTYPEVALRERELLEAAAAQANTNLSDFMRRKAVEAAEIEVLQRTVVAIPAAHWKKFEAWVNEPPKEVPALRELAETNPAWRS